MDQLPRMRPEDAGVSPSALIKYINAMEQTGFVAHNIMMIKNGKVFFEIHYNPFKPHIKHMLCSCSKSVAAAAAGFALDEGLIGLDERIVDIFPEKLDGKPHPYIAAMTVKHLLSMTTAYADAVEPRTKDWTREFLNGAPTHYPGTIFGYDSIGTHTLCDIIQTRAKTTVHEYLTPRLFEPLGIAPDEVAWEFNPGGINHGGGGASLTPEAMAKFGLVHLNGGVYNGKQVLPKGWADEVRAARVAPVTRDGSYKDGYGYKFWRVQDNGFACLGLAGQAIIMHPDKNFVFVGTANGFQTDYHYFHMSYMWQLVYPEIKKSPVPYEDAAFEQLTRMCDTAEVFLPGKSLYSLAAEKFNGKYLTVGENKFNCEGFMLIFNGETGELLLKRADGEITIPFGVGRHIAGPAVFQDYAVQQGDEYPNGCGSAGVWADGRTFVIQSHITDTLQYFIITVHFGENAAVLQIKPYGIYKYEVFPCQMTHVM